jgi:hypothetical protein
LTGLIQKHLVDSRTGRHTQLPLADLFRPKRIGHWSLMSVQQRLVKTGGRLITHGRYDWLLLAESHLIRRLCGALARRIAALPVPVGSPGVWQ